MPKARIKRIKPTQVPNGSATAGGPVVATGFAYEIKVFPDSQPADKVGPYTLAAKPPPSPGSGAKSNFGQWLDYIVQNVGARVEKMNALQFMLDVGAGANASSIKDELVGLAQTLHVPTADGPKVLVWPLAGPYVLKWQNPAAETGFDPFIVDLFFENEPTSRMVVNVTVHLTASDAGGGAGQGGSDSSSYIGTSSSR